MPLIVLLSCTAILSLALASVEPGVLRPLIALAGCVLVLTAVAAPRARASLQMLVRRYWIAALAFVGLVLVLLLRSGLFVGAAGAGEAAQAASALVGIALAAPAAAAIAHAYSRNLCAVWILALSAPLAFAALLAYQLAPGGALGRIPAALTEPGLVAGFGLIALLALHVAADELRRRPAPGEPSLPPLARRLFAPIAALMTSFAMMTLAGAPAALGATGVAALIFAAVLWTRARRSRVGAAIVPALAFVSVGAGGLAVLSATLAGTDAAVETAETATGAARWFAQGGLTGAALLAFVFAALMVTLVSAKDRGRRPSRGAPFLAGLMAYAIGVSWFDAGLAAPPAALLFAVLTGFAASYLDQEKRTPDPA